MIEELLPVSDWQAGFEIKYGGRWLELISFTKQSQAMVYLNCYDADANTKRRFLVETGAMRRVRRPEVSA